MKTKTESLNTPSVARAVRDNPRKSNPRLVTIHDSWIRGALVVHSASTR